MTRIALPSYLEQSDEVKARFDEIKQREVILELKDLQKVFSTEKGDVTALKNINFKAHRREFVCVIGASGCGKSTLIRILAGLESASAGDVLLDGGNSFWMDSVRREKELSEDGIYFCDCGTSGGVSGARNGACFMVGGKKEAIQILQLLMFFFSLLFIIY